MNSTKRNSIFRWLLVCSIATVSVGCEYDVSLTGDLQMPSVDHKLSPKKTITIKRKKPTITNPSPRPLSAGDITEIEVYNDEE